MKHNINRRFEIQVVDSHLITIGGIILGASIWVCGCIICSRGPSLCPGQDYVDMLVPAIVGSLPGLFWFIRKTGETPINSVGAILFGCIVGVVAVLNCRVILIPLICGAILIEALYYIIQRGYFQMTKKKRGKGKILFDGQPIVVHPHKRDKRAIIILLKNKIPEMKLVVRFWVIQLILSESILFFSR